MHPMRKARSLALAALWVAGSASAGCDPTQGKCAQIPGFTSDYSIDFTQTKSLPADWILADSETVSFGPSGLELSLAMRGDAPTIWTNNYMWYGQVEVVMQSAPGIAVITSAVLFSDDKDEIDWEFSGNDFGQARPAVQTNYFGKGITGSYDRATFAGPPDGLNMSHSFHTYTIDWTPASLSWSIDGAVIRTLLASDCTTAEHQYPQTPARFHLGLWDAGDPSTFPGTVEWAGGYTDLTRLPYTGYVKSAVIKPYKYCQAYAFGDQSGSGSSVQCLNGLSSNVSSAAVNGSSSPPAVGSNSVPSSAAPNASSVASAAASGYVNSTSAAPSPPASSGLSPAGQNMTTVVSLSTSTMTLTSVSTITSCAPTVTDCPARKTPIITTIVYRTTTVCPVTITKPVVGRVQATGSDVPAASSSPSSVASLSSSPSSVASSPHSSVSAAAILPLTNSTLAPPPPTPVPMTSSTIRVTTVSTITTCAPDVANCPARTSPIITTIVHETVTYCPIEASTYTTGPSTLGSMAANSTVAQPTVSAVASTVATAATAAANTSIPATSLASSTAPSAAVGTTTVAAVGITNTTTSSLSVGPSTTSLVPANSTAASATSVQMTTSTILVTTVSTITGCAPGVVDCPARTSPIITTIVRETVTVCPVTAVANTTAITVPVASSSAPVVSPVASSSPAPVVINSTSYILASTVRTVSTCAPGTTSCAALHTPYVVTEHVTVSTTICPVTLSAYTPARLGTAAAANATSASSVSSSAPAPAVVAFSSQAMAESATIAAVDTTATSVEMTTSYILSTSVRTLSTCAPGASSCSASGSVYVQTQVVTVATTVCPVTATAQVSSAVASSSSPSGASAALAASSESRNTGAQTSTAASATSSQAAAAVDTFAPSMTTSVLYSTSYYTVTACAPDITDCPASTQPIVSTVVVSVGTTVCPVTASEEGTAPSSVSSTTTVTTTETTTGTRTVTLASVVDATTPYVAGAASSAEPLVVVVPVAQGNGTYMAGANGTAGVYGNSTGGDTGMAIVPSSPLATFTGSAARVGGSMSGTVGLSIAAMLMTTAFLALV